MMNVIGVSTLNWMNDRGEETMRLHKLLPCLRCGNSIRRDSYKPGLVVFLNNPDGDLEDPRLECYMINANQDSPLKPRIYEFDFADLMATDWHIVTRCTGKDEMEERGCFMRTDPLY